MEKIAKKDSWQKSDVEQNFALKGLSAKKWCDTKICKKNYPSPKSEVEQKFAERVILYNNTQSLLVLYDF